MRVISGVAKRLLLVVPDANVRPTTDLTKETLFNIIAFEIPGTNVLDLFGGSGALGIEALSRGAKSCVFVDNYSESIQCIKKNLVHTKLIEKAEVLQYDYIKACESFKDTRKFDIIFLDPPYNKGLEAQALKLIDQYDLLSEHGVIIVESDINTVIDDNIFQTLLISDLKPYRTNKFTFIRKKGGRI